jgi:hypothetical protein
MDIEIEEIMIDGLPQYKLRLDEVLHGVFWDRVEASQYGQDSQSNWPKDFLSRPIRKL